MTRCIPFRHRWSLDASRIIRDMWGDQVAGYRTQVIYRCERCERVKVKNVKGAWVLEEGKPATAPLISDLSPDMEKR